MKRHRNDDTVQLDEPAGYSDPKSPTFVPILLREAFAEIDDATVDRLKREIYTTIKEPMMRTVGGRPAVADPKTDDGFDTCLHWLKTDEAARRVARANEREASVERNRRVHTCRMCERIDPTALSDGLGAKRWCAGCLDELHRQEVEAHAQRMVDGQTVAERIAATREQATT